MKLLVYLSLFLGFASILKSNQLDLKDGDRVAFVGGTFVEREAEYSLIETYLTIANKDKDVKFRNLGWSADTVRGESRGYEKPHEGYGLLIQKVSQTNPTKIVLTYGANEAWAAEAGLKTFVVDYKKLINDLKQRTQAQIILMSTPRQENFGGAYPNPDKYNQLLKSYFVEVKKIAADLNLTYIDLFNEIQNLKGLTSNSIHLNEEGYRRVAEILSGLNKSSSAKIIKKGLKPGTYNVVVNGKALIKTNASQLAQGLELKHLELKEKLLQKEIMDKNEQFFHAWRPQNNTYIFSFRKHEQGQNSKEIAVFHEKVEEYESKISSIKRF